MHISSYRENLHEMSNFLFWGGKNKIHINFCLLNLPKDRSDHWPVLSGRLAKGFQTAAEKFGFPNNKPSVLCLYIRFLHFLYLFCF